MKLLELNDLELVGLIGSGESGKVYLAKDKQGGKFAVKVYEGMSIHRGLLTKALGRLEEGTWPEGVMRLEKIDLDERPAFSVMPFWEMRSWWMESGDCGIFSIGWLGIPGMTRGISYEILRMRWRRCIASGSCMGI